MTEDLERVAWDAQRHVYEDAVGRWGVDAATWPAVKAEADLAGVRAILAEINKVASDGE